MHAQGSEGNGPSGPPSEPPPGPPYGRTAARPLAPNAWTTDSLIRALAADAPPV